MKRRFQKKKGEQKNMTLNEALIELNTFADNVGLSDNARAACRIGAEALNTEIRKYKKEIKDELEMKIREKIDTAFDEVASKYIIISGGIGISDDMKIDDYVEGIAEILATLMSDDIKGDD